MFIQQVSASLLSNHLHASLEEFVEGGSFQHSILEEGQVYELVYHFIALGISGEKFVFLFLLVSNGLLGILQVVFLFLGELFRLLAALALM